MIKFLIIRKFKNSYPIIVVVYLLIYTPLIKPQYFSATSINSIDVTQTTGEKPQSKVWTNDGKWWMVIPDINGTHLWYLNGATWTNVLDLSSVTDTQADCKVSGTVTYVLLFSPSNTSADLIKLTYSGSTYTSVTSYL